MTLYGSVVTGNTLLPVAGLMASVSGGVETSQLSTYTGTKFYGEVCAKTLTLATVSAIPAVPSGRGWVFAPGAGTYAAGTWTVLVPLAFAYQPISTTLRVFKYAGGTSYTLLGSATVNATSASRTTYTYTLSSLPAVAFGSSDLLYVDLWTYETANLVNTRVYESSSSTAGVGSDVQVNTPAFTAGLALYGSSVADSTLITAGVLSAVATGGTETSRQTTHSGVEYYGEIQARGALGLAAQAAIPATPTGFGWVYHVTGAGSFATGLWTAYMTLQSTYQEASTTIRFFRYRPSTTTYTSIGTITTPTTTMSKQVYLYGPSAGAWMSFAVGDLLYVDLWLYDPTAAQGDNPTVYESSSSAVGVAFECQIVTPPFTPTNTPRSLDGRARGKFRAATHAEGVARFNLAFPYGSGLTVLVGGVSMTVRLGSVQIADRRKDASPASFVVLDPTGSTYSILERMRVSISTPELGTRFTGYVQSVEREKTQGNTTFTAFSVTCIDESYLAGKRLYTGLDSTVPQPAGDRVCDLLDDYLAAEGVTAQVARQRSDSADTFLAGTHSGTVASVERAGLTLAPSGVPVTIRETTTADFAAGALSYTTAQQNALELNFYTAMKITGTAMTGGGGNLLSYVKFWAGSLTINAGDTLAYDIYVMTTSPEVMGGVDLLFTDGTGLRDTGSRDVLGVAAHPNTSLQGFADDMWYHRNLTLSEMAGKTVQSATLGLEGEKNGTYTYYVKDVTIRSNTNAVRATLFSNTLTSNQQIANAGYIHVVLSKVTASYHQGTRLSPIYRLAAVGIVADSLLSWTSVLPTQATLAGKAYPDPVLIEASIDGGATWGVCTNHAPLPGLLPGFSVANIAVQLRQTLSLGGPSPETETQLTECVFAVTSAAAASKTDLVRVERTPDDFSTGTLDHTYYVADVQGLRIQGAYRNWDDGSVARQTTFSQSPNGAIVDVEGGGSLHMRCDSGYEVRTQFVFAGQWNDFIAEYDVLWDTNDNHNAGLVYRTTHWEAANLTYAYVIEMGNTGIQLHYCSNSSSTATNVTVAAATATWIVGTWYHIKVVAVGTHHQIYVNDYCCIDVISATYNQTGWIGMRYYNNTGARASGLFDNFGATPNYLGGSRITPAIDLSDVGTVESSYVQWNAVTPGNTSVLVDATLDGGASWYACTNGGAIPPLPKGTDCSALILKLRQSLYAPNANLSPALTGMSLIVVGQYTATGTRISPPLSIAGAGTVGSSSLSWEDNEPDGTVTFFETSLDGGSTWNTITTSGDPIAGLLPEGPPVVDDYTTVSSAHYTATSASAFGMGTPPTVTFHAAISQLQLTGGFNGLYLWDGVLGKDVTVAATLVQCDQGGLVLRCSDRDNWYGVIIRDSGASTDAQTVSGIKFVGGVSSVYTGTHAINFVRGTAHLAQFQSLGSALTFTWDGTVIFHITDSSLSAAGKTGYCNFYGDALWHRIRAYVAGQDVSAMSVLSRVTLVTTDPRVAPLVTRLTSTVRGPTIQSGVLIPNTDYAYKMQVAACLDDLATQSQAWWKIAQTTRLLSFLLDGTLLCPRVISSGDLLDSTPPRVITASPAYRNRHYVRGGKDLVTVQESRVGNNYTLAWAMTYPIDSIESITVGNAARTSGIRETDTGRDFYYVQGDKVLSQEVVGTLPLTPDDVLVITYTGQITAKAMGEDRVQQALIAARDNSSGIVEMVETVENLTVAACQTLADARIAQYAQLARSWSFSTRMSGLRAGMEVSVFVPEIGLLDQTFVISEVMVTLSEEAGVVVATYDVSVTDGPDTGHWGTVFLT